MLEHSLETLVGWGDYVLGWLLYLPVDVALILVAAATAGVMLLLRYFTTNQDLLQRAAADKRRLKQLVREAKARKDKPAIARHRAVSSLVALKQLGQEGWPLLAALLPVLLLAGWCSYRLAFHAPQANQAIEVVLHAPVSAVGELVHIVPADGVTSDAWIQPIASEVQNEVAGGVARWTLQAESGARPYRLQLRVRDRTWEHDLVIGQKTYANPLAWHAADGQWASEVRLQPVKLFGAVPGLDLTGVPWLRNLPLVGWLILPPWMIAYLLVTIPVTFGLKGLLGIK